NELRARGAAEVYAARNDVTIVPGSFSVTTVGLFSYDVHVQTRTRRTLTPEGYVSEDPATGERSEFRFGSGETGLQDATARVAPGAASFLTGGYYTDPSGRLIGPGGQVGLPP